MAVVLMKKKITLLISVAGVCFCLSAIFFWIYERGPNPKIVNLFDIFYWWVTTTATVGYGDIVPMTWQGRIVAIIDILCGFYIYTTLVALIAESVHTFIERRKLGTAQVKSRNHIVICEYTSIADELIQSLPQCAGLANRDIVIISDLVGANPYPAHYFVFGVPINPASLKRANIEFADYVFIFANLRFADPDIKTLHIAHRVAALNPRATIFAELIEPDNELLKHISGKIIPMDSKHLIEMVIKNKSINLDAWLAQASSVAAAESAVHA